MWPVALHVDMFGAIMALRMNTITMEMPDLTHQAILWRHFKDKWGHTISICSSQRSTSQPFVSFVFTLPAKCNLLASEKSRTFTPEIIVHVNTDLIWHVTQIGSSKSSMCSNLYSAGFSYSQALSTICVQLLCTHSLHPSLLLHHRMCTSPSKEHHRDN